MNDSPPQPPLTPDDLQRRTEALFDGVIRIGRMAFGEMAQWPRPPLAMAAPQPTDPNAASAASAPRAMLYKTLPERLDLEQARARLPFDLCLPAWVPEGFALSDPISVTGGGFGTTAVEPDAVSPDTRPPVPFPLSVHLTWRHPDGRGFHLALTQLPDDQPGFVARGITPVPPGAVREVRVRDHPAALLERQFAVSIPGGETEIRDDAELRWEADRLQYSLRAFQWPAASQTLVTIAESIAPTG